MYRKSLWLHLPFILVLTAVAAGCAGGEPPDAAKGAELGTVRAATVNGASTVTLVNLPPYTKQTTWGSKDLVGYVTTGSDGAAIISAWFTVDAGGALPAELQGSKVIISQSITLAPGPHTIRLSVKSAAGNVIYEERSMTVDLTPPSVTLLSPDNCPVISDSPRVLRCSTIYDNPEVLVRFTMSDIEPMTVVTGGNTSTWPAGVHTVEQLVKGFPRGWYSIFIRATDQLGNESKTEVRVFVHPLTLPYCGNSKIDSGEVCDEGDIVTETECPYGQATCTRCSEDCKTQLPLKGAACGDGVVNGSEACDDGNTVTESCPYGQANCTVCDATCNAVVRNGAVCGDGVVNGPEACDDGNAVTETSCPYGQANCSLCNSSCTAEVKLNGPYCGDGLVNGSEACDDGNTVTETSCPYGQANCSLCNSTCSATLPLNGAYCGDGLVNGSEVCDDANTVSETSCPYGQTSCSLCNSTCSATLPLNGAYCGDGVVNGSEQCDDGNAVTESSCPYGQACCFVCNSTCIVERECNGAYCGDGVVNGPEVCDDGNTVSETSCPYGQASCSACNSACDAVLHPIGPYCGDGVVNGSEVCDDGNTITENSCPGSLPSCVSCNATCTQQVVVVRHDVGVLSPSKDCPSSLETVTIHMDNEDDREASYVSGWTGATEVDGNGNTNFVFCRANGNAFQSLQAFSDARSNYALLKLDTNCPPGSQEFARTFDNEDHNNNNWSTGSISPNTIDPNTTLIFCLFRGSGSTATSLPELGFPYGVFAEPQFGFSSATGTIFTDDEDTNNSNSYTADSAWRSAAMALVSGGNNTTLRTARAGFPFCGDNTCNGLESEMTCPSDCSVCGNGICGPAENATSCAYDCGSCGDGTCGFAEDYWSCSSDCTCGNGVCDMGEDSTSCSSDCGLWWCGDGVCTTGEDRLSCPSDC